MPHADPEARRAYQREYRLKNRDKIAAQQREYYRENKEARNAYGKQWREQNAERQRAGYRRRKHGIVDAPGERRVGPCEICARPADPLHCDHDHTTGQVRGWLCPSCNNGLGRFNDNPEWLRRAAEYLEEK